MFMMLCELIGVDCNHCSNGYSFKLHKIKLRLPQKRIRLIFLICFVCCLSNSVSTETVLQASVKDVYHTDQLHQLGHAYSASKQTQSGQRL
jgi:hypothetical protein